MSPAITRAAPIRALSIGLALLAASVVVPRSEPQPADTVPWPAPTSTPEMITIRVISDPPGAHVETAMHGVVGRAPVNLEVPRSLMFDARLSLDGHISRIETIGFHRDTVIELRLQKDIQPSCTGGCRGECTLTPCF